MAGSKGGIEHQSVNAENSAASGKPGAVIRFADGDVHHYAPPSLTNKNRKFVCMTREGALKPVCSIEDLELGARVCHTTRGEGVVAEFKKKEPKLDTPVQRALHEMRSAGATPSSPLTPSTPIDGPPIR